MSPRRSVWQLLAAIGAVFVLFGLLAACGSMAQMRVGGEQLQQPSRATVAALICMEQAPLAGELKAREYLAKFTVLSEGDVEELIAEGRLKRFRGECDCIDPGCSQR